MQRVVTQLVSDLLGDDVDEGKGETVEFAYRGTKYSIDLTAGEADAFDQAMAMYVEHATKVANSKSKSAASANGTPGRSKGELKNIRDWARANGYEVSERGRIKGDIVTAYHSAN